MEDMNFDYGYLVSILESTPDRVSTLVHHLDDDTLRYSPEKDHFSILDIIGHFIHGEIDDWIPRLKLILNHARKDKELPEFKSFDRYAHKKFIDKYSIEDLINQFSIKRKENLKVLQTVEFSDQVLESEGIHPSLGKVNVRWLLNTWVSHDLSHLNQMNRILVHQFRNVGPWKEYLRILQD